MPQNITDVSAFTSPVTSVADGDIADGADFLAAPQALANRTRFLLNQLAAINPSGTALQCSSVDVSGVATMTGITNHGGQTNTGPLYQSAPIQMLGSNGGQAASPDQLYPDNICRCWALFKGNGGSGAANVLTGFGYNATQGAASDGGTYRTRFTFGTAFTSATSYVCNIQVQYPASPPSSTEQPYVCNIVQAAGYVEFSLYAIDIFPLSGSICSIMAFGI